MSTTTTTPQAAAITALMTQRQAAKAAYDKLLSEPDSYSIQGSVSATNKKLADLRSEIDIIDSKLKALVSASAAAGAVFRRYPNYNNEGY